MLLSLRYKSSLMIRFASLLIRAFQVLKYGVLGNGPFFLFW
jgi:hypothetical protein